MDFTDNLLSVERKIRRRLKWKLLFQGIQNATCDSQSERIANVKEMELLILEIKGTRKENKSNKKGISLHIGSKIKKLRWKIEHRQNARQVHSKSFIPEILLKNKEFNTNSIIDHHIKYVHNNAGAKDDILKNLRRTYSAVSLKENINHFYVSCPNVRSESYSELPAISQGNIKRNNDVTKDQTVKQKKEKKSLLQIIDNLHLSNSMNKEAEYKKRDNNEDVLLSINKSNNSSSKENITPNKIRPTKTFKKKQQTDEPSVIRDFHHNLISNEDNFDGEQGHIISVLSSSKYNAKMSMNVSSDVAKKQETILFKEQHCTINSDSYPYKLYTVKTDGGKTPQNVDDAFKVPAIPTKKIDNSKSDNGVILNRTCNLLQIAKSAAVDNDQEKADTSIANTVNRTRMLIESFLQNLCFKQTNYKFGVLSNTKSEMYLSESDQRYVYKYAQYINAINRYNDLLSIVNYVEQQSPEMTKYILGVTVLDAIGRSNDSKYKYLVSSIKRKITAISKDIQKNNFEIYKEYVLWLFEAKRKR